MRQLLPELVDRGILYANPREGRVSMRRFSGNGLFTMHDEHGRGRCVMLASSIISAIIAWLTTDIFYTSFLMIYGVNLVNIGVITFIPYIAGCFVIFSPSVLERFRKRRWVLVGGRLLYYTLNILGITLVPVLVKDPGLRIVCFVAVIFLANLVSALMGGGFAIWHLNFIPNEIRAEFFLKQSTISNFVGIGISLVSGIVADMLASSPYADAIIIAFRYISYFLALVEVAVLALPKEYPYPKSQSRPRLRDIVTMPLSSRPFMLTMLVIFMHTFFTNVPASFINYYLLNNVGVQYTFIYGINMIYPFALMILQPVGRRLINRYGWFKVLAVAQLIHASTWAAYACVTRANYLWLYPAVRIFQHVIGVGANTAYSNVAYVNLPPSDQTNYLSFSQLTTNLAAFLGMMMGTGLVALIGEHTLVLSGMHFTSVQILLLIHAFGNLAEAVCILANYRVLDPHARELAAGPRA